jgi:hypothetical protein
LVLAHPFCYRTPRAGCGRGSSLTLGERHRVKKPKTIAGLGWYTKEQWPEYRRLMEDDVDETHEVWLAKALRFESKMKKEGIEIVRVPVDLTEFDFWCSVHKKKRDGAARSEYVRDQINRGGVA